ncbi:MAG: RNA ligase, partial [Candidatus Heimdallarchaeaceae archaeon]
KEDGSLMTLYFDWIYGVWMVQTSGTPEADVPVGSYKMTFADLFWDVFETYNVDMTKLDPRKNYVFELCTKYNQVVAMHDEPKLVLLNVRNLDGLSEATYPELVEIGKEIGIPAVHSFDLNSETEVREMFEQMGKDEEGIVAYDGKNRVKIKNPAYVIAHRSETNYQQKHQFKIIQMNEQDEFVGVLSRYRDDYYKAEHFWLKLVVEGYKLRDTALEYIRKGKQKEAFERDQHYRLKYTMRTLPDAGQTVIGTYDGYVYTKKEFVFQIKPLVTTWNRTFTSKIYKMFDTGNSFEPEDVLREMPYEKLQEMFNKLYDKII